MRGVPLIQWRDTQGSPTTVGDSTITPVARSLVARWPGGGAVWSGPAAVMIERNGKPERIPVRNLNARIRWVTRAGAVALIATWTIRDRKRRKSND